MRLPIALLAVLILASCQSREANLWRPAGPDTPIVREIRSDETLARQVAVAFAPVALGALQPIWPEAREEFAFDLAARVDVLGRKADADGFAAGSLPGSDDAAWTRWPVAEAAGADYVVLTSVIELKTADGAVSAQGRRIIASAIVEMRVLDNQGNVRFRRRGRGDWEGLPSPKFPGPNARPESRVVWLACSNAVGALLEWLEHRNQAVADGPAPTAERTVGIEVASDPPGADVLVDGIFRGNTPCTLTLPASAVVLRIERRGYFPWEHRLVPEAGLRVRPALDPVRP